MITVNENQVVLTITETNGAIIVTQVLTDIIVSPIGIQGPTGAPGLMPVFTRQNDLSVLTGKARFYFESTRIISLIRASVGTAPTGSEVQVAVYINGSSIGTVTIPAGQNTATLAVSQTVNSGDYASVSILSVGSTYAGGDLTVTLTVN